MIIKRGFSLLGIVPKYRVFVNNELISKLRVCQQVNVSIDDEFELYFETGLVIESGKKNINNKDIYKMVVNVNPVIRISEALFWISLIVYQFLRDLEIIPPNLLYLFIVLIIGIVALILFFALDFFNIKYYDSEGKRIILNANDEYINNKNDI